MGTGVAGVRGRNAGGLKHPPLLGALRILKMLLLIQFFCADLWLAQESQPRA